MWPFCRPGEGGALEFGFSFHAALKGFFLFSFNTWFPLPLMTYCKSYTYFKVRLSPERPDEQQPLPSSSTTTHHHPLHLRTTSATSTTHTSTKLDHTASFC